MNRYHIHYHSRTLVSLAGIKDQQVLPLRGWRFDFTEDKVGIVLVDNVKNSDGINLHTGLNMFVDVGANSEGGAKETSKNIAETLLNLVTFSTLAYCSSAKLVSVMEVCDKGPYLFEHYAYPFDEWELIGSRCVIDENIFRAIFENYNRNAHKQRIMRTLSWLRKGVGEENKVDQFISYWVGLEVIKHILRRTLRTRTKNLDEWAGVEDVFIHKLSFQDFGTIKQSGRNGLLHGFRELDDEFMREIAGYVEPIRKTLIFCIGSVLGLEDSVTMIISSKTPWGIPKGPSAIIKGEITNLPPTFEELVENYPVIDAEISNREFSLDESGDLNLKFSTSHHFRGPSDTKWDVKAVELWGDKDAGIRRGYIGEVAPT